MVSDLQRELLPRHLPELPGLRLAEHYETSRYAGGDYYDAVGLPDGRCGLLVADSEGHSAPAAVMMAMTCALFRSCPELHGQPGRLLAYINDNLCKVNRESFVTAIYAVLDPRARSMQVARAGHPLPILFRPGEAQARELPCEGVLMMGFDPYDSVPVVDIPLAPGDRLSFLHRRGVRTVQPPRHPFRRGTDLPLHGDPRGGPRRSHRCLDAGPRSVRRRPPWWMTTRRC